MKIAYFSKTLWFQSSPLEESSYLELIDEISEVFIKQDKLLGTFIDLPKTFDIVDHETISNKSCFYGINDKNIDWLKT